MNNGSKIEKQLNDTENLELFVDLLYRNLLSNIQVRNPFSNINRELEGFIGVPPKKYVGQLLYIISDVEEIKKNFTKYLSYYFLEENKRVKQTESLELVFDVVHNMVFFEEYDIVIIKNVDELYKIPHETQKKVAKALTKYLERGGKLLVTGDDYKDSGDALSDIFYQGNLLNLTY